MAPLLQRLAPPLGSLPRQTRHPCRQRWASVVSLSCNQMIRTVCKFKPRQNSRARGKATNLNFGILKGFGAVLGRAATSARAFCMSWMACMRTAGVSLFPSQRNSRPHAVDLNLDSHAQDLQLRAEIPRRNSFRVQRTRWVSVTRWALGVGHERCAAEDLGSVFTQGEETDLDIGSVVVLWAKAHTLECIPFVCHCSQSVRTNPHILPRHFSNMLELNFCG
jgi:hypothetical protein